LRLIFWLISLVLATGGSSAIAACAASPEVSTPDERKAREEQVRLALGGAMKVEELDALLLQASLDRQDHIARCMNDYGFEYEPMSSAVLAVAPPGHDLATEAYVEEHGYGIVSEFLAPLPEAIDPNEAIVDDLPQPEAAEWEKARDKCLQEAFDAIPPPMAVLEQYADQLADVEQRVAADARVLGMIDDWTNCMFAAGFIGMQPNLPSMIIAEEASEIVMTAQIEDDDIVLIDEIDVATGMPLSLIDDLKMLQRREVKIAVADYTCRSPFVDRYNAVLEEYLDEFIRDVVN